MDLDGTVNGNVILGSSFSGVGAGMIGVQELGGIHSCASDKAAPTGFSCPTSSGGSLINTGNISLIGTTFPSSRGNNAEAGSALIIGGSIDGGFLNYGPGTSNNATQANIRSAGLIVAGVIQPTVLIDPTRSITGLLTAPRGPVILGPVTADADPIDAGYSLINRGSIAAQPLDSELSSAAMMIQGASSTISPFRHPPPGAAPPCPECDEASPTSSTASPRPASRRLKGGMLNTGTITAVATTTPISSHRRTTATALYIGPFATVPRWT